MFVETILFVLAILGYYAVWFKRRTRYWSELGVASVEDTPVLLGSNPMTDIKGALGYAHPVGIQENWSDGRFLLKCLCVSGQDVCGSIREVQAVRLLRILSRLYGQTHPQREQSRDHQGE